MFLSVKPSPWKNQLWFSNCNQAAASALMMPAGLNSSRAIKRRLITRGSGSSSRLVSVTVFASGTLRPKPDPLEPIQGSFRSFHVPSGVRARLTSSVGSPRSSLGRISAPSNKFLVAQVIAQSGQRL